MAPTSCSMGDIRSVEQPLSSKSGRSISRRNPANRIGDIAGDGGTQRLPRWIGSQAALRLGHALEVAPVDGAVSPAVEIAGDRCFKHAMAGGNKRCQRTDNTFKQPIDAKAKIPIERSIEFARELWLLRNWRRALNEPSFQNRYQAPSFARGLSVLLTEGLVMITGTVKCSR